MLMKFYENNVKLSSSDVKRLRELREINEKRLSNGLKSIGYPNYDQVIEQGSISMNTAIKNVDNEYDIDLAVIFNSSFLSEETSSKTIKEDILKALTENDAGFKKDPELRTNAVTLWYSEGYHVDFAIYKKNRAEFKHAGAEWSERDPFGIKKWFAYNVKKYEYLKEVIQLIKYIVKNDSTELKISGLMITVLVVESFENFYIKNLTLETCLIESIKYINNRFLINMTILNPDNNINLMNNEKDVLKIDNFKKLISNIVLSIDGIKNYNFIFNKIFKTDFFKYSVDLNVDIFGQHGNKKVYLDKINSNIGDKIHFRIDTSLYFDKIRWEVNNTGSEAILAKCLNYYIESSFPNIDYSVIRTSAYRGVHSMTCYLYLNNILIEEIKKYITII